MKIKPIILYCIIAVLLITNIYQLVWHNSSRPFPSELSTIAVPNEEVALEIAEAVLVSVYGEAVLACKPFNVDFNDGTEAWAVMGSLPDKKNGGTPAILIKKQDGRIIDISELKFDP